MRPLSAGEMLEVGTRLLEAGDFRARSLQADLGRALGLHYECVRLPTCVASSYRQFLFNECAHRNYVN